ncbi:hypothetical protein [Vibrio sp. T11.5]|uniref:hypothetical protein n=1 Tax=Vibrio sp. T11.5 TaxID=2998836 RepID=UPI0022CD5711|nr:hypothetical protein [Vibrio sp. T11.5]MDA0117407.1 hypothetical protein [Vibrio sp. T11.5]
MLLFNATRRTTTVIKVLLILICGVLYPYTSQSSQKKVINELDLRGVSGYLEQNYRLERLSSPFNSYVYIRNENNCGVLSKIDHGKARTLSLPDKSVIALCGDISYFGNTILLYDKPMGFGSRIEYSFKLNKKEIKLENMYFSDNLGNYYSILDNKEMMISYDEDPRKRKLVAIKSNSKTIWLYDIKNEKSGEKIITKLKEISIKENEDIIVTGATEEYMESEFFVFYKLESDRFQGYVLESDITLN